VASLSQGRTGAAQCGLFTYKSVPVIFEPLVHLTLKDCAPLSPLTRSGSVRTTSRVLLFHAATATCDTQTMRLRDPGKNSVF